MSRATETHDAWALEQWERHYDAEAQHEQKLAELIGDLIAAASEPNTDLDALARDRERFAREHPDRKAICDEHMARRQS